jgi:hypothetical protein
MRPFLRSALLVFLALIAARAATPAPRFELRDGDRVVFLGDTISLSRCMRFCKSSVFNYLIKYLWKRFLRKQI